MALELPAVFPMILSQGSPTALVADTQDMGLAAGTNLFLMYFRPDPETGAVGFANLDHEDRRLTADNAHELRLAALAVTLDAWRILHRMTVGSGAARDHIFESLQAGTDINHPLHATGREWTLRSYQPNITHVDDLGRRVFADGKTTPPLTGRASLMHTTGRLIDIAMHPPTLGLHLAVGWVGPETEAVQVVYADEDRTYTQNYYFHFSGEALLGLLTYLGLNPLTPLEMAKSSVHARVSEAFGDTALPQTATTGTGAKSGAVAQSRRIRVEAHGGSVTINIVNLETQEHPFMPLPAALQSLLWDRAVRRITSRTLQ